MATRYILWILLMTAFACSSDKQKATENSEATNTTPADDRVVILPQIDPDTLKGSLKAWAKSEIGDARIEINYYSPAVRGRMIWGGLVAFDNIWVTGAHRATSIEFDQDLKIDNTVLAKGKYAIFTIPGRDAWTFVINKNWNQHLADDYDPSLDILRVAVEPKENGHQERLRYEINELSTTDGVILISWEKLVIPIAFSLGAS